MQERGNEGDGKSSVRYVGCSWYERVAAYYTVNTVNAYPSVRKQLARKSQLYTPLRLTVLQFPTLINNT